jgi:putative DNA primase/helicase
VNEIMEAALCYASWGWSVIPISRTSKKPLIAWKKFQTRLATEEEIRTWWTKWPNANVGIATGTVSGLIVLDVDSSDGLMEIEQHGGIPATAKAKTGKGHHYYLKHPGGVIRNFARKLPGCDLRGDGGYVVAPPSIHESGVLYEWEVAPNAN